MYWLLVKLFKKIRNRENVCSEGQAPGRRRTNGILEKRNPLELLPNFILIEILLVRKCIVHRAEQNVTALSSIWERELSPQCTSPLGLQNYRNKKPFDLQYSLPLALLRGPEEPLTQCQHQSSSTADSDDCESSAGIWTIIFVQWDLVKGQNRDHLKIATTFL